MSQSIATSTRQRLAGFLLLALLCLLAVGRSALGTRLDSFTIDEPWHVVAGAHYVRTGDFHLNPEQPPLVKLWVGAFMGRDFKLPPVPVLKEKGNEREFTETTMYEGNDSHAAQARARLAMWSFHGLLLFVLGLLCWRAFGLAWAAGTLAFLAIEPSIGAHLPVVMMDLALGLTLPIAALCAGLLFSTWRWRWAATLGVALALCLGAKHSALAGLLGLGLLCVVMALRGLPRGMPSRFTRLAQIAFAALLGLALLWAQYGFHFHARGDGGDPFNMAMPDKIAGLQVPRLRQAIGIADSLQLLPRSYLWGLADTVRAGVEGRGQSEHLVWGHIYSGAPPWFTWPSIIASKIPLGLMAFSLLGLLALWRLRPEAATYPALLALAVMSLTHLGALMSSQGTYAGVRHALPIVVSLAILAGAAVALAWQTRSRPWIAAVAATWLVALGMTAREPRLWEYHNELAGGTANAWNQFANEGVDLGQRFHEINAYYLAKMKPSGKPVYIDTMVVRRQAFAEGFKFTRRVESLDDTNAKGIYEGWFVKDAGARMPWPSADWDPAVGLKGLTPVARFGEVEIWRGRQELPRARAGAMFGRVIDHIYKKGGQDWERVAARCAEIVALLPQHVGAGVELGNARLRLGDAAGARKAYQDLLDQDKRAVDGFTRGGLLKQVAAIDAGTDPRKIPPLRNPWLE